MSDLVARLRERKVTHRQCSYDDEPYATHAYEHPVEPLKDEAAAMIESLSAQVVQLQQHGPQVQRGVDGDGKPWMGTMREAWQDAQTAANAEAELADEARKQVVQLRAENARLLEATEYLIGQKTPLLLEAQVVQLRAFAQHIMQSWPIGDVDGDDLQAAAVKFGLLELKEPAPTEPCGDGCTCAEYLSKEEWADGVVCYRKTPLLKGVGDV